MPRPCLVSCPFSNFQSKTDHQQSRFMVEAQIDNKRMLMFVLKEYSHKGTRHYSPLLPCLLPLAINSVIFMIV